jgi:signal transduction histidine kinase
VVVGGSGGAPDRSGAELGRRIGLDHGPAEVVALAASFDAMLDRLEGAAETQRRLIEETSHELRTPLSVLATNADVLLAHPEPTVEVYRKGLERSKAAAARLQATIDELLVDARGRARTIARRPSDLMAIVTGVVKDAQVLAAQKQIDLAITGPPTAECPLDQPTVGRAVSNLLDNAIGAAPAGSRVQVDVEVTGSAAKVSVTDHGPGIPRDDQAHVFERFWRGRHDSHGSGLGLPIARQIALAHGGDVTVTSPGPAGDGCVFELTLRR